MRWLVRVLPSLAAVVVAVASFALSYVALRDESAHVGAVPGYLAWLVPVVVDGGVICGSAVIWANSWLEQRRQVFPFVFVTALVAVSVTVNVAHAGATPLSRGISALPPLVLLGSLELVAGQHRRHAAGASAQAAREAEVAAALAERDTRLGQLAEQLEATRTDLAAARGSLEEAAGREQAAAAELAAARDRHEQLAGELDAARAAGAAARAQARQAAAGAAETSAAPARRSAPRRAARSAAGTQADTQAPADAPADQAVQSGVAPARAARRRATAGAPAEGSGTDAAVTGAAAATVGGAAGPAADGALGQGAGGGDGAVSELRRPVPVTPPARTTRALRVSVTPPAVDIAEPGQLEQAAS